MSPPPIDVSRFEQLKASGDLPSPKGVALAVMRLTRQEGVSMADLAKLIRTDPAFAGRLMKAANSLIGYGRRPIVAIPDALTVLGLPAVRNMALGFSLLNNYRRGACESFDYPAFWSASLLTAVTMQAVAVRTRIAPADESYCVGLLARVGELALATLYPHDYARICRETADDRVRRLEMENRSFAMTHAELGAAMLADWGMPRLFTDAVYNVASLRAGSAPEGSRQASVEHSLVFSRELAGLCGKPGGERPALRQRVLLSASLLGCDEDQVAILADKAAEEWEEWGSLLDVPVEAGFSFEALSADGEGPAGQGPGVRRMRILLADADLAERERLHQALDAAGHEVAEAADGFSATEIALDFHPDLLLLGWKLPDISALELLAYLRRTRIGRAIHVIVLAEDGSEDKTLAAFDGGADDIVSRPVSERLLLARIAAGRRLADLHFEIEQDREELRHFAAELAVSNRRLQEAALTDPLTGFRNRRHFAEQLAEEWELATRQRRPLSCIVLDVDHFKQINDSFGHDAGDQVLLRVAEAIRGSVRSQDFVARLGGDEFVVLCPDCVLEAVYACAARICRAVAAIEPTLPMAGLRLSVSAGIACRDASTGDAEALLRRADQSLYQAKQAGRNRVGAMQAVGGGS